MKKYLILNFSGSLLQIRRIIFVKIEVGMIMARLARPLLARLARPLLARLDHYWRDSPIIGETSSPIIGETNSPIISETNSPIIGETHYIGEKSRSTNLLLQGLF